MSPLVAILYLLSLITGADPSPPLVRHGGAAAPRAWLAALPGGLWICWDDHSRPGAPDPACWQRIDLAARLLDPRELRIAFLDPSTLLVRGDDTTYVLARGDHALAPTERPPPIEPQERLAPPTCSPTGYAPARREGRWLWRPAPCAAAPATCVAPGTALPPPRPSLPLGLTLGVEVRARELRHLGDSDLGDQAGLDVVLLLGWSVDPTLAPARRAARAEMHAAARPRVRPLPASAGPLAAREREALAQILCGGQVP